MSDTLSVVVTNWNYGEFLGLAIDSIEAQTHTPDDWFVVDDGSDDPDSLAIYEGLEDERVRYQGVQRGAVAAYNRGLKECLTEWIVYLDADDMIPPEYLEQCLHTAQDQGVPWVYADSQLVDENGEMLARHKFPQFNRTRLTGGNFINSAALVKAELLREAGGWHEHHFEDWDLWKRVADLGAVAAHCPDTVLLYRQHGGGRMNARRGM